MLIRVAADGTVGLEDAADLRRFGIHLMGTDAARTALDRLGRRDGADHAWIAPDQVRALAGPQTPEWEQEFAAMVRYAAGKGWTDGSGAIRAHIDHG